MADLLILTMLRSKQAEIKRHIGELNLRLSDARADLVHVVACISMFDPKRTEDTGSATAYYGVVKALKRAELFVLCKAALEAAGKALDTRELALHVIKARGWNPDDRRLHTSVAHKITLMLTRHMRRGDVRNEGLRDGVTLWAMPTHEGGRVAKNVKGPRAVWQLV